MSDGEVRTDDSVSCCFKQNRKQQQKADFFFLPRGGGGLGKHRELQAFSKFLRDVVKSHLSAKCIDKSIRLTDSWRILCG